MRRISNAGISDCRSLPGQPQFALCTSISYRRSRISRPAAIASTASTVLTVAEIRRLSSGKSPVRINQTASRTIPRFLPAKEFVIANVLSFLVYVLRLIYQIVWVLRIRSNNVLLLAAARTNVYSSQLEKILRSIGALCHASKHQAPEPPNGVDSGWL